MRLGNGCRVGLSPLQYRPRASPDKGRELLACVDKVERRAKALAEPPFWSPAFVLDSRPNRTHRPVRITWQGGPEDSVTPGRQGPI
jgi:hypothetical protein